MGATPPRVDVVDSVNRTKSASKRVVAVLGALAAAALVAIVLVVVRRGGTKPAAAAERDVPHLEGGVIVMSEAYQKRAGLTFGAAERAPFRPAVKLVGSVSFNPAHVGAAGARLRGTVRRTFKFEGDPVKAGEALAEIESAELGEAQASVAQAEATVKAAEVHAKREQDLLDKSLTTAREAEVAASDLVGQQALLRSSSQRVRALGGGAGAFGVYVLRAPLGGRVVERHVAPGQSVDPSLVAYKVADLAHLWVELSVFERDLGAVATDDEVDVSPLASPETHLAGRVAHVGMVLDPVTRSTDVRVAVDEPAYPLRPGQSVTAVLRSRAPQRDAILVPEGAVVWVDGKATVFVAQGNEREGRIAPVAVELGASDGERREVLSGLEAGARVATAGAFALKSELFR